MRTQFDSETTHWYVAKVKRYPVKGGNKLIACYVGIESHHADIVRVVKLVDTQG